MTSKILRALVYVGAILTALVLAGIVGYILINGIPHLKPSLFEWTYTSENVSLMPALIDTILMALLALALSVPTGVGAAIYLVEYARSSSRFVRAVRMTAETLQGIPSIIYGLFGLLFFTTMLGWGLSLISGACTLAIMVLPVVMRTTEEALLAAASHWGRAMSGRSFAVCCQARFLASWAACCLPLAAALERWPRSSSPLAPWRRSPISVDRASSQSSIRAGRLPSTCTCSQARAFTWTRPMQQPSCS